MVRKVVLGMLVAVVVCAASLVAPTPTASACSCVSPNLVDMVAISDVAFTGTMVSEEGDWRDTAWGFDVDGVIKGQVGDKEFVYGDELRDSCSGRPAGFDQPPVVIFATEEDGRLIIGGCTPTPSIAEFKASVERSSASNEPTGVGTPGGILVGQFGNANIAILDEQGRALEYGALEVRGRHAAHCPGSATGLVVPSDYLSDDKGPQILTVDLNTLAATGRYSMPEIRQGIGSLSCADEGTRAVFTYGFGPDTHTVHIVSVPLDGGPAVQREFGNDVSRIVVGPSGIAFALPAVAGGPIQLMRTLGLEPAGGFTLPEGVAALDAAVSPDEERLALLVRKPATSLQWDTGATRILTVPLESGMPIPGEIAEVRLPNAGDTIFAPQAGAADTIRWIDDATWVVQATTPTNNRIRMITMSGEHLVDNVFASWGGPPVPVGGAVLRATKGGVRLLTVDGERLPGDPAPNAGGGALAIAALIDPPELNPQAVIDVETIEIRPVAAGSSSPRSGPGIAVPGSASVSTVAIIGAVAVALAGGAALVLRRRQRRVVAAPVD